MRMDKIEGILGSIKKLLGIDETYLQFDVDIVTYINSAFVTLSQIGIAPCNRMINGDVKWKDFFPDDESMVEMIKTYVYMRVRLMFDPPTSSVVMDTMKASIAEFEWRLQHMNESHMEA